MHKKMTVLIVDDEELARRLTREYLKSHLDLYVIGECDNGLDAVDAIMSLQPDIVFLDIQMPKLNGLEVLASTGKNSGVIFTTAYDQYALKAFDQHAVDYLLKPFSQTRFDEALNKARIMLGQTTQPTVSSDVANSVNFANLTNANKSPEIVNGSNAIQQLIAETLTQIERIVVRDRGHTHIILTKTIEYVEAQDDYINIHFEGKSLLKTQSLSELEAQLQSAQFVRIHRSYLLHLSALKNLDKTGKDSHVAVLHNGTQLPISRSGLERLKAML